MATKNKESTRYYSNLQEDRVAKLLGAYRQSNSGASLFAAGDVYNPKASLLIECKTCMSPKESFSIKKEWVVKNKQEAKSKRLLNNCLAFSFGPEEREDYFIIDGNLMKYLVQKLEEEYDE